MIKSLAVQQEEEKKKLLQMVETGLWLYGYDDIFSDFDPRPYSQRAISEDFLEEAKKLSIQKASGKLQLNFSVPKKLRDIEKEKVIKKRLHDHFKRHSELIKTEFRKNLKFGGSFIFSGIIIMFLAAFILFKFQESTFLASFFVILLEPAGWFLFWEGSNLLIFESRKMKPDLEFYEDMAHSDIEFCSY